MPFITDSVPLPPQNRNTNPAHVMVVPHYEVQWNRPVFRAPALSIPSNSQTWSEVPFTAHFRAVTKSQSK